jgi:protein phosphatase
MGGAAAGEVASEIAVTTIRQSLLEIPSDIETPNRLRIATELANDVIWKEAQQKPELTGMGATVTAALVRGATAFIAQVGDSRAYLVRGDRIKQITKDQSYAQALRDSGIYTAEQIANAPQNVILQALGAQPAVDVGLTAVELLRNDYLVICSDGLSGKIKPDEMCAVVRRSSTNLTSACRRLVDMANERGGEDNITVIVALFDGVGLDAADESTSITGSFKSLSKDHRSQQPIADTMPLSSMPRADETSRTVMMSALPSIKRATPEPKTESAPPEPVSPQPVAEPQAPVEKPKPVTLVLKSKTSEKKRSWLTWLIVLLILVLLFLVAAYFLGIELNDIELFD